jgi:PilZ domain-containing protein
MVESGNDITHRRRLPRQEVHWKGICLLDGDLGTTTECEVVDVSVIGVGIVLEGPVPSDLVGRTITVFVQASDTGAVSLRLIGEIRYVVPSTQRGFRIGSQFAGLSETERSILDTFERMRLAW